MSHSRSKIAIVHAAFLGGGAEAVTLWTLQALQEQYSISLMTLLPIDLEECNASYGTHLDGGKITVIPLFRPNRLVKKIYSHTSMFTFRQQVLARSVRRDGKPFDLLISTYNEMDLGSPGIQYIHSPFFGNYSREARRILNFPDSFKRRAAKRCLSFVFGASAKRVSENCSLTNSHWTAFLLSKYCGVDAKVLYPPVFSRRRRDPAPERRTTAFLCVGRFARDKRIEQAIQIIDRVRSKGFPATLRVVGSASDLSYIKELESLRRGRAEWLAFEYNASRYRLLELIQEHSFGLQPREAEQFGIAVAEMASAGCIPFVPIVGGQAEIVGEDPRISFNGIDNAVEKILQLVTDPGIQEQVRDRLQTLQQKFSPEYFMGEIRCLVNRVLDERFGRSVAGAMTNRVGRERRND